MLRVTAALNLIPLAIGASVFDWLLIRHIEGPYGLITALAWLVAALMIVSFPARRVQRWGYKIGEGQLRVARGWLFRTDTIVPFVRVHAYRRRAGAGRTLVRPVAPDRPHVGHA